MIRTRVVVRETKKGIALIVFRLRPRSVKNNLFFLFPICNPLNYKSQLEPCLFRTLILPLCCIDRHRFLKDIRKANYQRPLNLIMVKDHGSVPQVRIWVRMCVWEGPVLRSRSIFLPQVRNKCTKFVFCVIAMQYYSQPFCTASHTGIKNGPDIQTRLRQL